MSMQALSSTPALPSFAHEGAARPEWLRHIGLLNDYVRIPYANGSSFATQFLYREFRRRGHEVTVVGPRDPEATARDMPERYVLLRALPLRNHPGVHMPLPSATALARVAAERFDIVLGQTNSELTELGVWLRATQHVPFLAVNTLHLRSAYNVLLPDALADNRVVTDVFDAHIMPSIEQHAARVYNQSDGLIVLCSGLARFWRERGVTVPVHVLPRSVEPKIFDTKSETDPFDPRATRGGRLLVVCRHTREKSVDRLLTVFARHVLPAFPSASLTLVGDGPDHEALQALARQLGIAHRTFFTGEHALPDIPAFYRHADLFVYASLSETYGQVVSEALWCGLPVVAFADGIGISDQVEHALTGALIAPGPDAISADERFGATISRLLRDPSERRALAQQAALRTRARVHPEGVVRRYYEVFEQAREHCRQTVEARIARPFAAYSALGRWAAVQSLALGLGCLRRPAVVNRHGRKQPTWSALERS
jgi:1,2-diacylglycerol 3-alpha-glucosyltransferase